MKKKGKKGDIKNSLKKLKANDLNESAINFIKRMKEEQEADQKLKGIDCENN